MPMPKKPQAIKQCANCGGEMIQPRWANGKLDSTFKNRKFCSIGCNKEFLLKSPATKPDAGRKRAQRLYPLMPCVMCGSIKSQRHHKDGNPLNNSTENIKFLCQTCHAAKHVQEGNWGKTKILKPKACAICGSSFIPTKSRDKLCKKASCSKEMGKRSAELRWASKTE